MKPTPAPEAASAQAGDLGGLAAAVPAHYHYAALKGALLQEFCELSAVLWRRHSEGQGL